VQFAGDPSVALLLQNDNQRNKLVGKGKLDFCLLVCTIKGMEIEYDQLKNATNIGKHGVSFDMVAEFDWETSVSERDIRREYGEILVISYGLVGNRLYALVWTKRNARIRPISFRKANEREREKYEKRT